MTNSPSDALVFFGATGDLAYKKIFPSLQAMVKRDISARDAVANRRKFVMAVSGGKAPWVMPDLVSSASQPICQNSDQRLSPS